MLACHLSGIVERRGGHLVGKVGPSDLKGAFGLRNLGFQDLGAPVGVSGGEGQAVAEVEAGLTLACRSGCLVCVFLILAVFPESAGVACVPPVGLVGPASVTFPVVASGEPVSVPDNLLKICKAKPVIFKGRCSVQLAAGVGRLEGGGRNRPHPGLSVC